VHKFWWDMNVPAYKDLSINDMIRNLQPKAVINNRGFDEGDFGTPERDYEIKSIDAVGSEKPVEACQSVGMESWGYKKDEDYYTDRHLSRSIDKYLCRDANYLLNVGPTGEGLIPEESSSILRRLGMWYLAVKESYNDIEQAPKLVSNPNVMLTSRENILYVHFNKDLVGNGIKLKPINVLPKNAILLNNGNKVDCLVNLCPSDHIEQKAYLRLRNLPANGMENTVLVVKLEFDRPLKEISMGKPDTRVDTDWQK
jgi:alpha-L-fucosidase